MNARIMSDPIAASVNWTKLLLDIAEGARLPLTDTEARDVANHIGNLSDLILKMRDEASTLLARAMIAEVRSGRDRLEITVLKSRLEIAENQENRS